jgi:NADH:ubiquinone reductase (H+-translocating)
VRLSGRLAWLLWGAVHVFFLMGFRNRIAVLLNWLWAYFTFERGSRLITSTAAEE